MKRRRQNRRKSQAVGKEDIAARSDEEERES